MNTEQVFIGGQWRAPSSGETYATINPATEEESARVAKGDERDIDLAVQAARRAFDQGPWPKMTAAERARDPVAARQHRPRREALAPRRRRRGRRLASAGRRRGGIVRHGRGNVLDSRSAAARHG